MKILVIGGNRFVGLRLTHTLSLDKSVDLHIVNRTGQAPHAEGATIYKADRARWESSHVDRDFDVIVDFAAFNDGDIRGTLDYFKKVGRYIFVSSESVYDLGPGLREEDLNAKTIDLSRPPVAPPGHTYQDGKRRAEA